VNKVEWLNPCSVFTLQEKFGLPFETRHLRLPEYSLAVYNLEFIKAHFNSAYLEQVQT